MAIKILDRNAFSNRGNLYKNGFLTKVTDGKNEKWKNEKIIEKR